jgi:hypothetical protein
MPRSSRRNHDTTARPLAAFALTPNSPATARPTPNARAESAKDVTTSASAATPSPVAITARSPMRSARAPHARTVAMLPNVGAARIAPTAARDRPSSSRICSATAARPSRSAAKLPCATIPTARTTHR